MLFAQLAWPPHCSCDVWCATLLPVVRVGAVVVLLSVTQLLMVILQRGNKLLAGDFRTGELAYENTQHNITCYSSCCVNTPCHYA